jgi:diadenosine tetraphosphate (Ap4A) HIT family hydrolase
MFNKDCLFCKIASGDVPSSRLYEDQLVYVFKDIAPRLQCISWSFRKGT